MTFICLLFDCNHMNWNFVMMYLHMGVDSWLLSLTYMRCVSLLVKQFTKDPLQSNPKWTYSLEPATW